MDGPTNSLGTVEVRGMPEAAARAKGTHLEGAPSEAAAARKVRDMFTRIAPRYDLLNHLLSLELDRLWRARTARRLRAILARPDALILDLCCGTGDLAFSFARSGKARIIGADFSRAMLLRAKRKSIAQARAHGVPPLPFFEADALRLPFADSSFDLVATAFGFRNLANYADGLREILRTLKSGGTLAILEFTEPPPGLLGNLYRWYFRSLLPYIGKLISGDPDAYSYLPASVALFPRAADLATLMRAVGYASVDFQSWTLGAVVLHTGSKPSGPR